MNQGTVQNFTAPHERLMQFCTKFKQNLHMGP